MSELDLKVALARETPDLLNVAFLLIGPVTPRTLFDLRRGETTIQIISLGRSQTCNTSVSEESEERGAATTQKG